MRQWCILLIMLSRVARGLARGFCAGKQVQQAGGSSVIEAGKGETPVYLQAYNKAKY